MVSEGYHESTNSDSGTEADDEHFLKGLPAPRLRPHKGLRGVDGALSNTPSPRLSPALLDTEVTHIAGILGIPPANSQSVNDNEAQQALEKLHHRRTVEIFRRTIEVGLLLTVSGILCSGPQVRQLLKLWRKGRS